MIVTLQAFKDGEEILAPDIIEELKNQFQEKGWPLSGAIPAVLQVTTPTDVTLLFQVRL